MLLSDLQNSVKREQFIKNISLGIEESEIRQTKTNTGIKNANDLKVRILDGDKIVFNYKTLVEDGKDL